MAGLGGGGGGGHDAVQLIGVPKSIQTARVVRMVTKVKGRPYFFVITTRLQFQVPGK